MNYHLMIDGRFIDGFIEIAEKVAPKKNVYVFTFNSPSIYIKSTKGVFAPFGSMELKNIIKRITVADRVYIHWFHEAVMQVIEEINLATPVYLFFWGGDLIEQSKDFNDFNLDVLTKRYVEYIYIANIFYWTKRPLNYFRMVRNYVLFKKGTAKRYDEEFAIRKRFLNRLNYFCHWNILDLEIINGAYGCSPTFMNFFYDSGFKRNETHKKTINNYTAIWLGNSETETNNHLDAIFVLKHYRENNIKIICPLSYGNKKYGDFVSTQGQLVFAEKWDSIRNFMPLETYFELLKNVDIVVMFHNRTQAAANIFAFIKMGKKVYLKKQSTIYHLMENNGITVYDANTIKDITFKEFSKPLTEEQIQSNIKKISNLFSEKKRLEYMSNILN